MKSGYEFQSEFARSYVAKGVEKGLEQGRQEGLLEAKAQAVLAFLEARGLEVAEASFCSESVGQWRGSEPV